MARQTIWPAARRVAVPASIAAALLLGASGCGSSAPGTASSPSATRLASLASAPAAPLTSQSPTPSHATPLSQSASPSAAMLVVIYGCDRQPVGRPAEFVLFCGDAGEILQGLTWSGWGGPGATATGRLREKTCTPNCAAGGSASYSATVRVRDLTGGRYRTMHISAPDAPNPSSDFKLGPGGPTVEPNR